MSPKPRNSLVFFPLQSGVEELVLASGSRYRAQLLERLLIPFSIARPDVDESPEPGEAPAALVTRLARTKARAGAARHPRGLIIGSDQVAVLGERILGKPGTEAKARAQLAALSGNTVRFLTGLCIHNACTGAAREAVITNQVEFRDLSAEQIADYVALEQPLDCAGAFKSEGLGIALFRRLEGADPNALIGLPLIELCGMLAAEGLPILGKSIPD